MIYDTVLEQRIGKSSSSAESSSEQFTSSDGDKKSLAPVQLLLVARTSMASFTVKLDLDGSIELVHFASFFYTLCFFLTMSCGFFCFQLKQILNQGMIQLLDHVLLNLVCFSYPPHQNYYYIFYVLFFLKQCVSSLLELF